MTVAILQNTLDMKIMSHLQVTVDWALRNSYSYNLLSGKQAQSSKRGRH